MFRTISKITKYQTICLVAAILLTLVTVEICYKYTTNIEEKLQTKLYSKMYSEPKSGGLANPKERDAEVDTILETIKSEFENQTKKKFESLEAISYKTQVVAGRNYFIKAKAKPVEGEETIAHLRIWKKLDKGLELTAYQLDKTMDDEILHFEPERSD